MKRRQSELEIESIGKLLRKYTIPAPVAGGLLVAVLLLVSNPSLPSP